MQTTLTMTKQWQIYIPENIRKLLGLKKSMRLRAEVKNKQLVIIPEEDSVLKLAGSIKTPEHMKDIDIDNIRDYIDYSQW